MSLQSFVMHGENNAKMKNERIWTVCKRGLLVGLFFTYVCDKRVVVLTAIKRE